MTTKEVDVLTGEIIESGADPSLGELATLANVAHAEAMKHRDNAVEYALACGAYLVRAKAQLKHGEWLPWLAANFDGSEDTAERYVKVAANSARVRNLDAPSLRQAVAALAPPGKGQAGGAHVGNNTGEFEWYTPPAYITAAAEVMGAIDLDPASSRDANDIVKATNYFAKGDDALNQQWLGRVWMNPPYSQPHIEQFIDKLVASYVADDVTEACVLVNNATDTAWFQAIAKVASAICFTRGRVRFWHPEKESSQPLQGQAVIYLGANVSEFRAVFGQFGFTVVR